MMGLDEKLQQYKLPLILSLIGFVLIIGGIFSSGLFSKPPKYPKESLVKRENSGNIVVEISGAVNSPGVYTLKNGSRVQDAIQAAGGFSNLANNMFVTQKLNLAQKISDGIKIYIPFEGDGFAGSIAVLGSNDGKVSINSATQAKLEDLPGVGPATALKIISERPYASLEDLLSKKIISRAVYEKVKDLVVLD